MTATIDVVRVDDDGVHVVWRKTETCEQPDDLNHVPGWQARRMLRPE